MNDVQQNKTWKMISTYFSYLLYINYLFSIDFYPKWLTNYK